MSRKGDWIQTFTGKQFWPLDPRPEDFDILDIAHALSMKCRFNGHSRFFYSVAQHSVLVSRECERGWPGRVQVARWGLMHDLAEAYLPDVPRPIKQMMTDSLLRSCEWLILSAAAKAYYLHPDKEPSRVRQVDNALLATEAGQVMGPPPEGVQWDLPEPPVPGLVIEEWSPAKAREEFLSRWKELGGVV